MRNRANVYAVAVALGVAQLGVAAAFGPAACDWGVAAYFTFGLLLAPVMWVLPHFNRRGFQRGDRSLYGMGFMFLGAVFWLVGWMLAFSHRGGCL
jgi:hypothetical protein